MTRRIALRCVLFFAAAATLAHAQTPTQTASRIPTTAPTATVKAVGGQTPIAEKPPTQQPAATPALSDVERIARLQRAMDADERRLAELKDALNSSNSEFKKARQEFNELDVRLDRKKKEIERLERTASVDRLDKEEAELEKLTRQWQLSKERFELALEEGKVLGENIKSREQKLKKDREALDKLTGTAAPAPPAEATPPSPAGPAAPPQVASSGATPDNKNSDKPSPPAPPAVPSIPNLQSTITRIASGTAASDSSARKPARQSAELKQATDEAAETQAAAQLADDAARSVTDRKEILLKNIESERALLETARKTMDNADQTFRQLQEEIYKKYLAGTPPKELAELRGKINDAADRRHTAHAESRKRAKQLDRLHSEVAVIQADQIAALEQAKRASLAAEAARLKVEKLSNPFAWKNIVAWLEHHGPRLMSIVLTMLTCFGLSKLIQARLSALLARHAGRGSNEERENRARTLLGVLHSAVGVLILTVGSLMLLDELGVPIGPLMGGAAMIGLAVAFGAQSLIKDYFSGFMILLEQQYLVNDVVRIGEIAGQVERITLRVTVLRDLEGRVHFVPHGQIGCVTNLTHGWSRALVNVAVSYHENVDEVIRVLLDVAKSLRREARFAPVILDDPEMLGVDELKDNAVMVKFYVKTRPLKQWMVKRELLRRIKNKFDELGIEIPSPPRPAARRPADTLSAGLQQDGGNSAKRVA